MMTFDDIDLHIDFAVVEGDFVLNDSLNPSTVKAADTIAQDIKHRILESGLLVQLIGLRNQNGIKPILTELELLVEQDNRLKPGSINIIKNDNGLSIAAKTRQYGGICEV